MVPSRRGLWLVVSLALLVSLGFAAFTDHAWEDYFITLRASRNLAEGHGLVFTPGERLHTFTSPLGTLVPALFTAVVGPDREALALWLFRGLNASLLAAAAALLWRRLETLRVGVIGRLVAFGLLLADPKLTDFSINGMETAILAFFVVWLWTELEAPAGPRVSRLALGFAGLMWTRPDAFVLAGALAVAHLVFRRDVDGVPSLFRTRWSPLWRGVAVGVLLYLPWLGWAWWYYGSPVPHTIVAKAAFTPAFHWQDFVLTPFRLLTGQRLNGDIFLPAYAVFGGWPPGLRVCGRILTALAALAWLAPRLGPAGRRVSFALFLGLFYLNSITLFPWYVPPWTVLAILALAFVADALYAAVSVARPPLARLVRMTCLLLVVGQATVLGCVAWQMRVHQRHVEQGVRRAIGEWLHTHAARGDTVFLEPLGYIGYYSRLKTYDFPGLSSMEVVREIQAGARGYVDVIARLHPQWLVLRPFELLRAEFQSSPVLDDYDLIRVWSAMAPLNAIDFLPGRRWCEFEAQYYVFRRKAAPMPK